MKKEILNEVNHMRRLMKLPLLTEQDGTYNPGDMTGELAKGMESFKKLYGKGGTVNIYKTPEGSNSKDVTQAIGVTQLDGAMINSLQYIKNNVSTEFERKSKNKSKDWLAPTKVSTNQEDSPGSYVERTEWCKVRPFQKGNFELDLGVFKDVMLDVAGGRTDASGSEVYDKLKGKKLSWVGYNRNALYLDGTVVYNVKFNEFIKNNIPTILSNMEKMYCTADSADWASNQGEEGLENNVT